ncbi:MAG: acetate kinase [Burkholderiaceae bacterium]
MVLLSATLPVKADEAAGDVAQLQRQIAEQNERIDALKQAIAEQEANLSRLQRALGIDSLDRYRGGSARGAAVVGAVGAVGSVGATTMAQAAETARQPESAALPDPAGPAVAAASSVQPVGQAPEQGDRPPEIAPIFPQQPGVMTPAGKYVLEPSLQYYYSSANRIALVGYTIIPALLIGVVDIRESKRSTLVANLTGRWGVTNRIELEARIPYVYRSDSSVGREILQGAASDTVFNASGSGIGDVDLTGRWQLNDGGIDKPFYIASLRFKSRTGHDPFEAATTKTIIGLRDGLQTELPTGSGFYTLQPALTMLYPSDPAVFFGTLSYAYNFKRNNVTREVDGQTESLGTIAPGGVFGFNFGMGFSINEKSSFSLGYEHSVIGKIKQNGRNAPDAVTVQLGSLLLGYSYQLSEKRTLNLALGAGLTRDTPDVSLTLRIPTTF